MTALLQVEGVGKKFGEFAAVSDVTLDLRAGETLGLIGPNGAGKTTLFNMITGFLKPDTGHVRFDGAAIDRLSPAQRVARGLVRSFQKPMLFPALSLRENIAMASRQHAGRGLSWLGSLRATRAANEESDRLLAESGLTHRAEARVADLAYGEQRMADLLIALALRPRLLLLDEPTAGLAPEEARRLLAIIRRHDAETSVMLITHEVEIAFAACDRIAMLNLGRLLCLDTPAAVQAHPAVRDAYLGALAA
ncbi:ABC transporter ATP-binding protein [Roseomonas sp. 18066]|uniref:ABC transporter ATP-binding protein n=1 Tax=Roseomonas sp. 18066 TaxID=2681412 RepID=UPI0013572575|nr:ATP-binding cassette domain-containing protein [Roseomonas sp. 18066]